jgi:hypothetical protein
MKTILAIVYFAVGVLVALNKDYLGDIDGLSGLINLLLAIVLWPLVLLGVDFNLHIGGNGDDGKSGEDKKNEIVLLLGPGLAYLRSRLVAGHRRSIH